MPTSSRYPGTPSPVCPGGSSFDARENHLVTDSRFGPAEAIPAGELLLAALTSCAMANIQSNADADGGTAIDSSTSGPLTDAESRMSRVTTAPPYYIDIHGVDQAAAKRWQRVRRILPDLQHRPEGKRNRSGRQRERVSAALN